MDKVVEDLDERSIDMSVLLDRLSLKALKRVEDLMDESESETIQLTAARDLLDRGPRTSKVQRHQVMAMTLDGRDAQQIASALVEAAQARQEFSAASGNYIRATDMPQVIAPAPEAPTPDGD